MKLCLFSFGFPFIAQSIVASLHCVCVRALQCNQVNYFQSMWIRYLSLCLCSFVLCSQNIYIYIIFMYRFLFSIVNEVYWIHVQCKHLSICIEKIRQTLSPECCESCVLIALLKWHIDDKQIEKENLHANQWTNEVFEIFCYSTRTEQMCVCVHFYRIVAQTANYKLHIIDTNIANQTC